MKLKIVLSLVLLLSSCTIKDKVKKEEDKQIVINNGTDLDYIYLGDKAENIIISPLSIKMALAMLANGFKEDDEAVEQLLRRYNYESLDSFNNKMFSILNGYTSSEESPVVEFGNNLWYFNKKRKINQRYKVTLNDIYEANTIYSDKEIAAKRINDWVSEITHKMITEIISEDDIKNNDELESILINVIYFKGNWKEEFSEQNTTKEGFTNIDSSVTDVDMMNNLEKYNYSKNENLEVIELEYNLSPISMYVILPKDNNYILTEKEFNDVILNKESKNINLKLPKFKTEYNIKEELKDYFTKENIQLFDNENLTEMFEVDNINSKYKATDIIHVASIEVDEKGTTASAVTEVMIEFGSAMTEEESPVDFIVNRPFHYIIRDNNNEENLFIGKQIKFNN